MHIKHCEPELINDMIVDKKCSLEIDYKEFIRFDKFIAIWLAEAPRPVLEVMDEAAKNVVFCFHDNYKNIHQQIYVRITDFPCNVQIFNIRRIHLNKLIRMGEL